MTNDWIWGIDSENGVAVIKSGDTLKVIGLPESERPKLGGFTADMCNPVDSVWDRVIPDSGQTYNITDYDPEARICIDKKSPG